MLGYTINRGGLESVIDKVLALCETHLYPVQSTPKQIGKVQVQAKSKCVVIIVGT